MSALVAGLAAGCTSRLCDSGTVSSELVVQYPVLVCYTVVILRLFREGVGGVMERGE